MVDLNSLVVQNSGWTLEAATGINGADQIAGGDFGGHRHAFVLAAAAPEPSNFSLLAVILVVFALRRFHTM